MAILASEILDEVNKNLRRTETDIDPELKKALRRISVFGDFLFGTSTQSIIDGDNLLSLPENYKTITNVGLNSLTDPSAGVLDNKRPLILIGWNEYLTKIGDSATKAQPYNYAIYDDEMYLYPISNSTYSVDIYFTKYHDYSTTIEYSEKFRETIEALATLNVAKKFGLGESIAIWSPVSFGSLNGLMQTEPAQSKFTRFSRT